MKKALFRAVSFLLTLITVVGVMTVNVFALSCRHNGSTHWVFYGNTLSHVQICNKCGARIKVEDHDITDDSQWDFVYLDVDTDMSGEGTHRQICKKCGYTYYNEHVYERRTVSFNGANHPNVLACANPRCNHIKDYDEYGLIVNHRYYTKYVNFDYHVTLCAYCGYAPRQIYQNGFHKVEHVDYSKLDEYYVFANNGAYKQYKYLSDAEKKLYKTYYVLELGMQSHKADQSDYEKHNWQQVRNSSQHWVECSGCHATYDRAGHDYETYVDDHQGWAYEKTTYCKTCGWVKSIKYTNEKNDKGKWTNIKELLDSAKKILDYNGCDDDQPKPGHGGDIKPCEHPAYYTVYGPNGETRVDNFYYLYIGGKHEKRCRSCNETISTSSCSYQTETFEMVRAAYLKDRPWIVQDLGEDYTDWLYMEDYFKSGHYQVCSVCGGKKPVAHNWKDASGSHSTGDICKLVCKDCGFTMTYRQRLEGSGDPSPHTYLTYQDNYWIDANQVPQAPDTGCCSYTFIGTSSSHTHKGKCEVCGYEHSEHCDTDGWADIPGQPGKHYQFCSKCGGGRTVVSCGAEYVPADNAPAGFHAVRCPTCGDTYIPKTPCDYIIDEKKTDAFVHTYICTLCGYEWHDNHIRRTIRTNYVSPTATTTGRYDLVTYCEVCNKEIARTTVTLPKADNPSALSNVEGVYLFETCNAAHLGSGSSYLNGTIVMDGVAEYLARNSAALLNGVTFDPSHDFYVGEKHITANDTTRIVLYANVLMTVTDYTQDDDDLDGNGDRDEYTSMTATLTFTYSAYYVTTEGGVDYRDPSPLILDQPLDLSGAPVTMTLPLLTGLSSYQTMFVRQTTDGGENYTTYLGDFHSDYGMATVTFTTEDGFDGEFLFLPTEHWLEHIESQEPTDKTDGNIEYWYSKNQNKYYSDILCTHEITKQQTYINANTYEISFASGGGSGSAPAPITGVHKQEDVILPACTFTNPGYVFYGWSSGDWVYKAGDIYTVTGDAVLTAKWHLAGDTMCHITFHPNGDGVEGTMDEQICKPGDTVRLQKNAFTREGYTFYGWSTGEERQVPPYAFDNGTVSPETDLELYAVWQPTFYITFDANGGEGTMEPQAYESMPLLPGDGWYVPYAGLVSNAYTRDGYVFAYWAKNPDGSGDRYSDGGVSPMDTTDPQNITLYAIWEQTRFTVTFDANCENATGSTDSVLFDKGVWDVIPRCGYERDGYIFVKWAQNPDGSGSTTYNPGLLRTFNKDTTLYAVWQKVWTVTFDPNGGDDTMPAQTVEEGRSTKLDSFTLTRDGYAKPTYCWNTAPDGSGEKYYDGAYVTLTDDLTLYAQWTQTRFTVTYDPNGGTGTAFTQIVDKNELASGEYAQVEANTFSRERYGFSKWNTMPDGSGTNYTPGNSLYSPADMTLYAQWAPEFFTVTFDANGGEGTMEPQIIDRNVATVLRKNTFTREGYIFMGWGSSASATYGYNDEATYTSAYTYDVTLYARWAKEITITFDPGEGFGTMAPQVVPESTYTKLDGNTFLHETKGFNYWSLTPDGERAYYGTSSVTLTEDITLYAVWKNKTDRSANISLEDASVQYNGREQTIEAALDEFTQYSDPTLTYLYYRGTEANRENLLTAAPVLPGVYTVRAVYEDSISKGHKDAVLTITKGERNLTPTSGLMLIYGGDKSVTLRLSDADGSALEALTITSEDTSIVRQRTDADGTVYKASRSAGIIVIPFEYVGDGYTTAVFSIAETENYLAASAEVTVLSKSGYDVTVAATDELGGNTGIVGGTVTVSRPTAPAGAVVTASASAKLGWTLEEIVVTNNVTCQPIEVTDGTFVMPEAGVTVSASFSQNVYTVAYTDTDGVTYGNGLPTAANYGDIITLDATASDGAIGAFEYIFGTTVVTVAPDKNGAFTFKMPAENITIRAIISELHDVTAADGVTASAAKAVEGTVITLTVIAPAGCKTGAVTYTAGSETKAVTVGVNAEGETVYSFVMPDADAAVQAEFIPEDTVSGAISAVNGTSGVGQGATEAQIDISVDDDTASALKAAAKSVSVVLESAGNGSELGDGERTAALEALAQAGLISITDAGVKDGENADAEIRIVEKTYTDVSVKDYEESDNDVSMTLEITPKKQTVATAVSAETALNSDNSVPLGAAEELPVAMMTTVTVGIPKAMAEAAGGAGATVYVKHIHDGMTYEYPAVINGSAADGYTATFDNPNGYSEFTVSLQSSTVASFTVDGVTYFYPSFGEAIAEAIEKNATEITMYRMPVGDDTATVTTQTALTFKAAEGKEELIDFDVLYGSWIITDIDVRKASTAEELEAHVFSYSFPGVIPDYTPGDINGDGEVNIKDLICLAQYHAHWDLIVIAEALDPNGDGVLNVKDVIHLAQYLADWQVVLY